MKQHINAFAAVLVAMTMLAASCDEIIDDSPEPDHEWESTPIELTRSQYEISNDANTFGLKAFSLLCKEGGKGDIVFSPLSLSLDLSMCALGSAGSTADQMTAVLGFEGRNPQDVASFYKLVSGGLEKVDNKTTFTSANSIWADKSINLKPAFVQLAEECFNAQSYTVDFSQSSTADRINAWCRENTGDLIPKMIDKTDEDIVMSLLNAVYFKGKWAFEFDKDLESDTFHGASKNYRTDFMTVSEELLYAENDQFQLCRFPYGNGCYSLTVVLPREHVSLQTVADMLASGEQNKLRSSFRTVNAKLPKFRIEYTADSLVDILKSMGMTIPFTGSADFSNMSEASLYISDIFQKAYLDVNQNGTEAAAVTEIDMKYSSAGPGLDGPVSFIADRPFLFLINEGSSNTILFAGRKM